MVTARDLRVVLALAAVLAPASLALAQPLTPPPGDDERLQPGLYPAAPVPEGFGVPAEPGHPPFDIDWSVGLKGTITSSTGGTNFVTSLNPQFVARHDGQRADIVIEGNAEIARSWDGREPVELPSLHLGVAGSGALDSTTRLSGNLALDLSRPSASAPGLNPLIVTPAQVVTGSAGLGVERSFGRFNLGVSGALDRTIYGPTTRTDTGITDNASQNVWSADTSLRLGLQATPIFEVFAEGTLGRDIYDATSPSTGIRADGTGTALRGGIAGNWNGILTASASLGVGHQNFDHAGLADVTTQLYDASVTYSPDPTLNISASVASAIVPSGADSSGTARIQHVARADVDYTVNSWLRLRASADWSRSSISGSAETEQRHGLGAGADYKFNSRTALSADYGYAHRDNSVTGQLDTHTISLGITLRR